MAFSTSKIRAGIYEFAMEYPDGGLDVIGKIESHQLNNGNEEWRVTSNEEGGPGGIFNTLKLAEEYLEDWTRNLNIVVINDDKFELELERGEILSGTISENINDQGNSVWRIMIENNEKAYDFETRIEAEKFIRQYHI